MTAPEIPAIPVVGGPCHGQRVHETPARTCWICRPVGDRLWPGPYFPYRWDRGRYVWRGHTSP